MVHDDTSAPGRNGDGSPRTILAGAGRQLTEPRNATAATLAALPRSVRVVGATPASVRTGDSHRFRPARHGPVRSVVPINHASRRVPACVRRHCSAVLGVLTSFAVRMIAGGRR